MKGVRIRNAAGNITFDSTVDHVLFPIDEVIVTGSLVGNGINYDYPNQAGRKISASMVSPYQNGDIDGWAVLSSRVSYPGGIPRVTVFVDNNTTGLPVCDGYLLVFSTGAPQ